MRGRARGVKEGGAEVLAVGEVDLEPRRIAGSRAAVQLRRFRHDDEIRDELTAPPELAGDGHVLELGPGLLQRSLSVLQESGGAMQVQPAFAALRNRQVLQNLGL
jgi:hypothetical protein